MSRNINDLQKIYELEGRNFEAFLIKKNLIYEGQPNIIIDIWRGLHMQHISVRNVEEVDEIIDLLKQAKLMLEKE